MFLLFSQCDQCSSNKKVIEELQVEIKRLQEEVSSRQKAVDSIKSFISDEQLKSLENPIRKWSKETIIKSLKLRYALGIHGYNYLRNNNFPLPCYNTLVYRVRHLKLSFGVFHDIFETLQFKVSEMDPSDRLCFLSTDSMEISNQLTYNKNTSEVGGYCTLGDHEAGKTGSKLLLADIRGIKSKWKQVIGCHITGTTVDGQAMKQFIEECLSACRNAGLQVISYGSDMGPENRTLWNKLDVKVQRTGARQNYFRFNDSNVFVVPDVCHLLKNLKNAMLNKCITLPAPYCEKLDLPTRVVTGEHVKTLWKWETDNKKELRFLCHLKHEFLYPDNFQKMNVSAAINFFSIRTASALETAVKNNVLHKDALSTAHFIRIIHEWFSLLSSKLRKTSITKNNKETKYVFLENIINLIEGTQFDKGWKPLNTGIIMTTLSFLDICELLFLKFHYDFVLGHRFTQDALENIFSNIRLKAGKTPTSNQCLQALKGISVSQYLSDIDHSNYANDSDYFLLDFFQNTKQNVDSVQNQTSLTVFQKNFLNIIFKTKNINTLTSYFDSSDLNNLYFLCGSAIHYISKLICESCRTLVVMPSKECKIALDMKYFTESMDKGNLTHPSLSVIELILNCEVIYREHRSFILHNSSQLLMDKILSEIMINFPICNTTQNCNTKYLIIKYFFTIRGYSISSLSVAKKRKRTYGTASVKKKCIS